MRGGELVYLQGETGIIDRFTRISIEADDTVADYTETWYFLQDSDSFNSPTNTNIKFRGLSTWTLAERTQAVSRIKHGNILKIEDELVYVSSIDEVASQNLDVSSDTPILACTVQRGQVDVATGLATTAIAHDMGVYRGSLPGMTLLEMYHKERVSQISQAGELYIWQPYLNEWQNVPVGASSIIPVPS
jgi:hypothetical protein